MEQHLTWEDINTLFVEGITSVIGRPNNWSVIEHGAFLLNPATGEKRINPAVTPEIRNQFERILRKKIVPRILRKYPSLELYLANEICVTFELKHGSSLDLESAYKAVRKEREASLQ